MTPTCTIAKNNACQACVDDRTWKNMHDPQVYRVKKENHMTTPSGTEKSFGKLNATYDKHTQQNKNIEEPSRYDSIRKTGLERCLHR